MAVEATIDEAPVEEPKVEVEEAETPEKQEDQKTESLTIEKLAKEMGWKGSDEFQGREDDYVDAAEYIRRSKDIQDTMRKHLNDNKRKMTDMERGIQDLKLHNERVFKVQLEKQKREIDELRKQRREAIEEGDVEKVESLDGRMLDLYNLTETPDEPSVPPPDPEEAASFADWCKSNPWYFKDGSGDREMTDYADRMADLPEYAALPYERKLKVVTDLVKKAYPEKFKSNPDRPKAPANNLVEAPKGSPAKRQFTSRDLSEDQKKIMENFVKRGIMTEKQYINDLVEIGEIG
jgi:hypothetical protein